MNTEIEKMMEKSISQTHEAQAIALEAIQDRDHYKAELEKALDLIEKCVDEPLYLEDAEDFLRSHGRIK